jgi:putative SOS response-associated peptidase YedK
MCGRYTLRSKPKAIAVECDLTEVPLFDLRFNISPNQPVAVVRFDSKEGS